VGFRDDLRSKLLTLHEGPWEGKASGQEIERWLENFTGSTCSADEEQSLALHLLSVFTYFGARELRVLLQAMFRDLYRYPIVEAIRRAHTDTTDVALIKQCFDSELAATRFIGIGNPAESGTHLLYYFRQENALHRDLFINTHEIFEGRAMTGPPKFEDPSVYHYVFIDDFCGSGTQAMQYSAKIVEAIKLSAAAASIDVTTAYYVLAATDSGIAKVRSNTQFDRVEAVMEFDSTYKAFAAESRGCLKRGHRARRASIRLLMARWIQASSVAGNAS
jgi:hypothetical protein